MAFNKGSTDTTSAILKERLGPSAGYALVPLRVTSRQDKCLRKAMIGRHFVEVRFIRNATVVEWIGSTGNSKMVYPNLSPNHVARFVLPDGLHQVVRNR